LSDIAVEDVVDKTVRETRDVPVTRRLLVVSPWESRWSLGSDAGVSDDYNFIKNLSEKGFELHFLVPKGKQPSDLPFDNFYTHYYPNFFGPTAKWPTGLRRILWPTLFNIIVSTRLLLLGRRIKPDFILGHSHYSALPSYIAKELLRVPSGVKLFGVMDLVHTEWSRSKYLYKNLEQILALKIPQDVWIILDDGTKGRDAALRQGVPEQKIRFLPNGIDLEWKDHTCDPGAVREEFGVQADTGIILFLARLVASKRLDMLVSAIPEIKKKTSKKFVCLVAGDGEERHLCEQLARQLGVAEDVRFLGALPHARVPDIMSISDVFASTSRLTNMAIPTCEALVCGLPVVAFDVGDTREVIHSGDTGYVVPDGNTEELAAAIARLLENAEERRTMARKARQFAQEHFTGWNERNSMEIDIINDAIARVRL
jgi:glycosyltransferase involved in cell wall biosynthesis